MTISHINSDRIVYINGVVWRGGVAPFKPPLHAPYPTYGTLAGV
jgi:hypothetical protein